MCFSPQWRAIFPHPNFQKGAKTVSFLVFWLANVLRATAVCHFSTSQLPKVLRRRGVCTFLLEMCFAPQLRAIFLVCSDQLPPHPPALASLLFDPADTRTLGKTQHFATFLTFRAGVSSFFWLSRDCIFFLLALLLLCFSSSDSALHLISTVHFELSEVRRLNFLWSVYSVLHRTTPYYTA